MKYTIAFILMFSISTKFLNSQSNEVVKFSYDGKVQGSIGKLNVTFWSDDIIEYQIAVINLKNDTLFKQKGYAINPSNSLFAKHGMEFSEQIGPDQNNPIPAKQFMVFCNCDTWVNIKVSKDFSTIQVDCGQELLNKITNSYSNKNRFTQILGYFYLKVK